MFEGGGGRPPPSKEPTLSQQTDARIGSDSELGEGRVRGVEKIDLEEI